MSAAPRRLRVAVVTGTRAEYGLLQSTIAAIHRHSRLTLQLAVTGMHLLREFGYTIDQIRNDGWRIDVRVRMQRGNGSECDQAEGLARGVTGLARFFQSSRTDIVLVLGDRIEAMAGALAGVTTGRIVAHIHGGDVAQGDFDDSMRHAITKLAHIHLTATRESQRRVIRMGESAERVHRVGAPGLDRLAELLADTTPRSAGRRALVIQHASGGSDREEQRIARNVFRAVQRNNLSATILFPNTDRGCLGVIRAIDRHEEQSAADDVTVIRSLKRDEFLRLLIASHVLVGNSSSGVIEAPFAGVPVVNIGKRQCGRQAGGPAINHCDESIASIHAAIVKASRLRPRRGRVGVYGDGQAGRRIAGILATVRPSARLRKKQISY